MTNSQILQPDPEAVLHELTHERIKYEALGTFSPRK